MIVLDTFGGVTNEKKQELESILDSATLLASEAIQKDDLYEFKKLFVFDYPENVIGANIYENFDIQKLNSWLKNVCSKNENRDDLYCKL